AADNQSSGPPASSRRSPEGDPRDVPRAGGSTACPRARVARGAGARAADTAGVPGSRDPSPEHGHTPHAGVRPPWVAGLPMTSGTLLQLLIHSFECSSLSRVVRPRHAKQLEIALWRVLRASTCLPRSTSGSGCKASTASAVPV